VARRAGRLLVLGCLRPWAERIGNLVRPAVGESCLDLCSDGGAMAALLCAHVVPQGRVVVLDSDPDAACAETEAVRGRVLAGVARPAALPLASGAVDLAVSLFGLAHSDDLPGALAELRRVVRPGSGRVAVVLWAGPAGAPHEEAVRLALEQETGVCSAFIREALDAATTVMAGEHGLRVERLRDVVRFDGPDHLWAALVGERPVAAELAGVHAQAISAARAACAAGLLPYSERDGTLRVPVEAVVFADG